MKILLMLIGFILALNSCSEHKEPPFLGEPSALTFNGQLEFDESRPSASETKTSTEDLTIGTKIGIYVKTTVADGTQISTTSFNDTQFKNLEFTSAANNALTNNSGKEIILYTGASRYGIYAYSPRKDTDPENATSIGVVHNVDILWTSVNDLAATTANGTAVDLVFKHLGSQIRFQLVDNTENSSLDFSNATLTITGFTKDATLNVENGVLTLNEARKQTLTYNEVGTTETINTDILVDGTAVTIQATVKGVKQGGLDVTDFSGSHTYAFAAGSAYLFNVNVGNADPSDPDAPIQFLECAVADWVDTDSAEVPAT